MCSSTPDTSKADANAAQMTQLSEDQWKWVQGEWDKDAPNRAAATDRANTVSDLQIEGMRKQIAIGDEAARDYRTTYRPLEQKMAQEAKDYDTEANREELAGKARTDVTTQADAQRQIAERNMTSMGVNPSDPAYMAVQSDLQRGTALSQVQAGNQARTQAQVLGHAMEMDAIGVGRGVVGSQATSAGIANSSGNASVQNSLVPTNMTTQGIQTMNQSAGQAVSGLSAAGNIYQNSSKLQASADEANSSGTAAFAGAAMTAAAVF